MNKLEKFLSISSEPFVRVRSQPACLRRQATSLLTDIKSMLDLKNGFTAFESAIVVFPTSDVDEILGLDSWNSPDGWRRPYEKLLPGNVICFAHDLFGGQFGARGCEVIKFDPESGEVSHYADSLLHWAENLLSNYAEDTGWPLAHEWQVKHGSILPSQRLIPKQPFVLGGDFAIENLRSIDAPTAMAKWGRLYQSIRTISDGKVVSVTGWLD